MCQTPYAKLMSLRKGQGEKGPREQESEIILDASTSTAPTPTSATIPTVSTLAPPASAPAIDLRVGCGRTPGSLYELFALLLSIRAIMGAGYAFELGQLHCYLLTEARSSIGQPASHVQFMNTLGYATAMIWKGQERHDLLTTLREGQLWYGPSEAVRVIKSRGLSTDCVRSDQGAA